MGCSKTTRNQFYATLTVSLHSVLYGANYGWISSSYLQLQQPETTHIKSGPLNRDELGWVTSLMTMGLIVGTLFFGWLADRIGRIRCFLFAVVPYVINWLLIATARSVLQLCVARFLAGFAGGAVCVIPVFVTELAEDRLRSTLGTLPTVLLSLGMISVNIMGYFFHYVTVAWIVLIIPVVFLATFTFNPETPQYLEQNRKNGLEKSLKYYRGTPSVDVDSVELHEKLCEPSQTIQIGEKSIDKHIHWADYSHPKARKAISIGLVIVMASQLSGCYPMLKYVTVIFKDAGSNLSPLVSAIIVISIKVLGTNCAMLFVERAGRKTLLLISISGVCLGQVSMASYYFLSSAGFETSSFSWAPIAAFSLIMFSGAIGLMIVDTIIISEILPPKIRRVVVTMLMIFASLIAMIVSKIFPHLSETLGIPGVVSIFSGFSFIFTILIAIYVPETKGKSIKEIQNLL